jgi:dTDP-4-amino-4,6-dideoxygalactose transaminase
LFDASILREITPHFKIDSVMQAKIPFNKPSLVGKELEYIAEAINSGAVASDGGFTQACSRLLEERFGIHKALMTPSCTAALEMAAMLCDLKPGDEVILPSFTFASTANAVVRVGARPVFIDVRHDTLNLDEGLIESALTARTRAIFAVHYAGVGCEMDAIMKTADEHGLRVVEDAAQGVNAFYGGRALGAIGHLGAYSFHYTKNYLCGEGGALSINAPEMVERAEIIRDKGTNRKQFSSGKVDKYTWVDVGSSYAPSEIVCAFLYAQLERLDDLTHRRRDIYDLYYHHLEPLHELGLLRLPVIADRCASNYHLFYILLPDRQTRDELLNHLKDKGIQAVFHYVPLHSSPFGKTFGDKVLPVTEDVSGRLLRLPFFTDITEDEQIVVIKQVTAFLQRTQAPPHLNPFVRAASQPTESGQ